MIEKQYNLTIKDEDLTAFLILLLQARQVQKTLPPHTETDRIMKLADSLINETLPYLKAFETNERDVLVNLIMELMNNG